MTGSSRQIPPSGWIRQCWLLAAVVVLTSASAAQNVSPPRVVAVGDIHGDFDAFVGILQQAGIIDANRRWSAGKTTFVQTGDVTDRGPKVREALDFLMDLERQASAAGGRVSVLLGNHELMNVIGDLRDVSPAIFLTFADAESDARREAAYDEYVKWCTRHAANFQQAPKIYQPTGKSEWLSAHPPGYIEYRAAFGPQGLYGRWLRSKQPVLQLGRIVFMHAGINPERAPRRLEDINRQVAGEIRRWDDASRRMIARNMALPFFTAGEFLQSAQIELQIAAEIARQAAGSPDSIGAGLANDPAGLKALSRFEEWALVDPDGPMWFRGFATWPDESGSTLIKNLLSRYKVEHFVVGHTPQKTARITSRFGNAVFLIDTGMLASVYAGRASALEIQNGRFTAIYDDERITLAEGASSP